MSQRHRPRQTAAGACGAYGERRCERAGGSAAWERGRPTPTARAGATRGAAVGAPSVAHAACCVHGWRLGARPQRCAAAAWGADWAGPPL